MLRDRRVKVLRRGREMVTITPEVREFLLQPAPLIISKANMRASVHRRVHMDYIGIKQFDSTGNLTGELRIVGLFTASAYNRNVRSIPFLRRKADLVLRRGKFDRRSHSGRIITNILDSYPRDELFQIEVDLLYYNVIGILQLSERPRVRVFIRRDRFDRFVSAIVFVPKDAYDTALRTRIGELLSEAYDGTISAFYPNFPEGSLARVHFIVGRYQGQTPTPDLAKLEQAISEAARSWKDNLQYQMDLLGFEQTAKRYHDGFPIAYQDTFELEDALHDIGLMEKIDDDTPLMIDFYNREEYGPYGLRLKMFHSGDPIALSDRLPILENMGFRSIAERTYPITRQEGETQRTIWYHSISIETADHAPIRHDVLEGRLEDTFLAVWNHQAEDDAHNALVALEGLDWFSVALLRACTHYLRQAGIAHSRSHMAHTLNRQSKAAALLVDMIRIRFDPVRCRNAETRKADRKTAKAAFKTLLANVESLDEDRILRHYYAVIKAMIRTNAYSRSVQENKNLALAFKIRSSELELLPRPRPFAEIFVCSPRLQGVHLRGGPIARGGIRWSDRPEDFRTEILGLMKAQRVKNAVIVPVGSKGGFVPRRNLTGAPREAVLEEGIACYRIFIESLLSITDNLDGNTVLPPADLLRYDGDDPYLVVAADKGTASFSDIANEISLSHNYWLGDAFASGGSAGYDHKKMGITARGAWEAVKRHFREMDIDIQTTPFNVIGVGDMSGDVFGNGMLLSRKIRLRAAFDHRDIFIDPDPDPETSFAERERLFKLPRSSWADYDPAKISKGGGVFSRKLKSITLTPQMKQVTGLKIGKATPAEIIHALLKAPTDLMWFGGIGTYVRAADESNEEVGDRVNDPIRVTGSELGARVIGEGANLGLTQRGRIEFARKGGRLNTDAIDNSAGVNTSDVEVNIKIALESAITNGHLKRSGRNRLLARMTEEVGHLVLANNYRQTLALSLDQIRGTEELGAQRRLMSRLEQEGHLDRAVELLPDEPLLAEYQAQGKCLSRPEIAVLLSYAKITLFNELLEDTVVDDAYFKADLKAYFPTAMHRTAAADIAAHKLRREIVATIIANDIVNRSGAAYPARLADETGAETSAIAIAHVMARDIFRIGELFSVVDALDTKVPAEFQCNRYLELQNFLRRQTLWFLRNGPQKGDLGSAITAQRKTVDAFLARLPKLTSPAVWQHVLDEKHRLMHRNLPEADALRFAAFPLLASAPDIIRASEAVGRPVADTAQVYFAIGEALGMDHLLERAGDARNDGYFEDLAFSRVIGDSGAVQRRLATEVLEASGPWKKRLQHWLETHAADIARTRTAIADLAASGPLNLARLTVANGYMSDLVD
ncbi:MAG: NAD-glutamate dehydrogenase [Hyphomicrobiales bacterium]|nr:MAG: NAD-glutamate dehydrogenase [Hyphomicrobiales bacterium]